MFCVWLFSLIHFSMVDCSRLFIQAPYSIALVSVISSDNTCVAHGSVFVLVQYQVHVMGAHMDTSR